MKYNIKFKFRWRCGYRLWMLSRASKKKVGYSPFTSLKPRLLAFVSLAWLSLQITQEWFSKLVGDRVEPSDVFLAFTVDQGLNVMNAIEALNVPVVVCNAHRLNTVVYWMLGIAGSDKTCKNSVVEKNTKKLAACVGKFSHSAVNNSDLKTIQELSPVFSKVCELIRRNDTR